MAKLRDPGQLRDLPAKRAAKYSQKADHAQAVDEFLQDSRLADLLGDERLVFLDGGAKGGLQREWLPVSPLMELIAFEPLWPLDEEERAAGFDDEVEDPKSRAKFRRFPMGASLLPVALGKESGRRTFHETRGPSFSSFLPPIRERWDEYGLGQYTRLMRVFDVETTTLDAVVEERGLDFVDFVKLDTQGSELDILIGSPRTVGELAFGIRVECAFVPLYENQAYFSDIDPFLREHGFEFMDLVHSKRLHRVDPGGEIRSETEAKVGGQVIQADPLYFRALPLVAEHLDRLGNGQRERYLAGAVIACLVYSRVDYALALIELARPLVDAGTADLARAVTLDYPRVG